MYTCFTRKWWKLNKSWPDGREPDGSARKTWKAHFETEQEAREYCQEWNSNHEPGKLSIKCEYTSGSL